MGKSLLFSRFLILEEAREQVKKESFCSFFEMTVHK
jgi:hypothetical protein